MSETELLDEVMQLRRALCDIEEYEINWAVGTGENMAKVQLMAVTALNRPIPVAAPSPGTGAPVAWEESAGACDHLFEASILSAQLIEQGERAEKAEEDARYWRRVYKESWRQFWGRTHPSGTDPAVPAAEQGTGAPVSATQARCVRCFAAYAADGACSRRQDGCQGGRGEWVAAMEEVAKAVPADPAAPAASPTEPGTVSYGPPMASFPLAPPPTVTGGDFVPGVNGGPPTATPMTPAAEPGKPAGAIALLRERRTTSFSGGNDPDDCIICNGDAEDCDVDGVCWGARVRVFLARIDAPVARTPATGTAPKGEK